jgi:hypothetical protein
VNPEEYDADEHLREEHFLGSPITMLVGWLSLYIDGDVSLEAALGPMTKATIELNAELLALGKAVISKP